jgi:hypothetical protein
VGQNGARDADWGLSPLACVSVFPGQWLYQGNETARRSMVRRRSAVPVTGSDACRVRDGALHPVLDFSPEEVYGSFGGYVPCASGLILPWGGHMEDIFRGQRAATAPVTFTAKVITFAPATVCRARGGSVLWDYGSCFRSGTGAGEFPRPTPWVRRLRSSLDQEAAGRATPGMEGRSTGTTCPGSAAPSAISGGSSMPRTSSVSRMRKTAPSLERGMGKRACTGTASPTSNGRDHP